MNEKLEYISEELSAIALAIRGRLIKMSHKSRTAHLGSSLSCVDLLVSAYWNVLNIEKENIRSEHCDRFILSKGHAAATGSRVVNHLSIDGIHLDGMLLRLTVMLWNR